MFRGWGGLTADVVFNGGHDLKYMYEKKISWPIVTTKKYLYGWHVNGAQVPAKSVPKSVGLKVNLD